MDNRNMSIVFSSDIHDLTMRNASFDAGILRVAYTGRNRNNSFISKDTFEKCIPTIYNCPVVCNYDRETDSIGSHDIEIARNGEGKLDLINLTQPVGVVPESAKTYWELVEDDSGIHEYLCVEVLLWKRQEAYQKIRRNGVTDESMEISVKDGQMVDGVYVINDFEFTAFCLLESAEPCFESASLSVFSTGDFREQYREMVRELKECYSITISDPFNEAEDNKKASLTEGGEAPLEQNMELIEENEQMSLTEEPASEPETPVEEPQEEPVENVQPVEEPAAEPVDPTQFRLASIEMDELFAALSVPTIQTDWGAMSRYCYVDHDAERGEVYAYDMEDWKLYGFPYSLNGDMVEIDFDAKQRKKFDIVDFDEGDQASAFASVYSQMTSKYQEAVSDLAELRGELDELRQFRADIERAAAEAEREQVFAEFSDLAGNESFEQLRQECDAMDAEQLRERCFAIRGRLATPAKFAYEPKHTKLPVAPTMDVVGAAKDDEPYGGLFVEFGNG